MKKWIINFLLIAICSSVVIGCFGMNSNDTGPLSAGIKKLYNARYGKTEFTEPEKDRLKVLRNKRVENFNTVFIDYAALAHEAREQTGAELSDTHTLPKLLHALSRDSSNEKYWTMLFTEEIPQCKETLSKNNSNLMALINVIDTMQDKDIDTKKEFIRNMAMLEGHLSLFQTDRATPCLNAYRIAHLAIQENSLCLLTYHNYGSKTVDTIYRTAIKVVGNDIIAHQPNTSFSLAKPQQTKSWDCKKFTLKTLTAAAGVLALACYHQLHKG